jgi:predicted component of type VI protein secretion system
MRTTNQPMAKLVVLSEGMTGLAFDLKPDRTTVGRLDDNAVHIPEASVSSHHCEIIGRGSEVVVKDLNSTNGTFINGQQITEAVLKPGQILRLGQIEMRLDSGAPAASGSAPTPAPAAPATPKKSLDKTVAMPQGVKAGELGQSGFQSSATFSKKSNKANRIFIWVGVVFLILVVASIIMAYLAFQK